MVDEHEPPPVNVAILVDSPAIRSEVVHIVSDLGWECQTFSARDIERAIQKPWDLIIIYVPGTATTGPELVRKAMSESDARVVVISDDREPRHIADVLESGADDYIQTPFAPDELRARLRSLIERMRFVASRRQGPVSFIFPMRTITFDRMHITFAPREWDVLIELLDAGGEQMSPRELAMAVWGDPNQEAAAISTVSRVRSRLRSGQLHMVSVHTHRGKGYSATVDRNVERTDMRSVEDASSSGPATQHGG